MEFREVLEDMAHHVMDDAEMKYESQRRWHEFAPFECERQVLTDGGNTFRIKVEFEPNPASALMLAVERN